MGTAAFSRMERQHDRDLINAMNLAEKGGFSDEAVYNIAGRIAGISPIPVEREIGRGVTSKDAKDGWDHNGRYHSEGFVKAVIRYSFPTRHEEIFEQAFEPQGATVCLRPEDSPLETMLGRPLTTREFTEDFISEALLSQPQWVGKGNFRMYVAREKGGYTAIVVAPVVEGPQRYNLRVFKPEVAKGAVAFSNFWNLLGRASSH
ncbi:hypothetical protein HYU13_05515 [Candidatus Woesearchaeota archaeon]|nr:hypothetical protein [Candidatus Woesearchaeota archaeon]